jgi:hypothetical protein
VIPIALATTRQQFKEWFEDVLAMLYPHRNAGIAVFMISLPLAERYLRQKSNLGPGADLNSDFMNHLVNMFSALGNEGTARNFWTAYRHGFLHQATPSISTRGGAGLPTAWLTHDTTMAVEVKSDGSFCVHPVLFSQRLVDEIKRDFATYAGTVAGAPPLPKIEPFSSGITIHPTAIGTRGG